MGYLITAGSGLLLGLGLLIWGLRERSARHKAERAKDEAQELRREAGRLADHNAERADAAETFAKRLERENMSLRTRLNAVRSKLVACNDPDTIKSWLDSEMEEETL